MDTFKIFQLKYTNEFDLQAKCLKALIMSVHGKIHDGVLNKRLEYSAFKDPTPWDSNRLQYLQTIMVSIFEHEVCLVLLLQGFLIFCLSLN